MTQIAKKVLILASLLVVSACAQPSQQAQVFENYDYNPQGYNSYDTAYAPGEYSVFRMNNYY